MVTRKKVQPWNPGQPSPETPDYKPAYTSANWWSASGSPIQKQGGPQDYYSGPVPADTGNPEGGLVGAYGQFYGYGQASPDDPQGMGGWKSLGEQIGTGQKFFEQAATGAKDYEIDMYRRLVGDRSQKMTEPEQATYEGYKSMMGKGYSPEEMAAMRAANARIAGGTAQGLRSSIMSNMAKTGNEAGGYGAMGRGIAESGQAVAKGEQDILAQDAALKRQQTQAALQGMAGSTAAEQARYAQAMGLAEQLGMGVGAREEQAAEQLLPYAQLQAALQQFGTQGMQGLYNTSAQQQQAYYNALAQILGTHVEDYTQFGQSGF